MNWTEGNLARHSRGRKGKEVLLRQKEYFAKVRAGLSNPHAEISPSSISFLARSPRTLSSSRHRDASRRRSDASSSSATKKQARASRKLQSSKYFQIPARDLPMISSLHQQNNDGDDSLRQKRRKLLLQGDWVGTDVLKPINLESSKPSILCMNPWGSPQIAYHPMKDKTRHLLGIKSLEGKAHGHDNAWATSYPVSRSQLKIRVGSIERALDESSTATFRSSPHRDSACNAQASQRNESRGQRHPRKCSQDLLDGNREAYSEMAFHSSSEISSRGPILTSSPHLYHPIPHRSSALHLLPSQLNDSDDASSTKAQVGMLQPEIPFGDAEQNATWKEFVLGLNDAALDNSEEFDNPGYQSGPDISPGISHLGLSKPANYVEEQEGGNLPSRFGTHQDSKEALKNSSPEQPHVGMPDDVQQDTTHSSCATKDTSDGGECDLRIFSQRFTDCEDSPLNQPTCDSMAQHKSTEVTSSSRQERAKLYEAYPERRTLSSDLSGQSGAASPSNALGGVDLLPASALEGSLSVDALARPPTAIQSEAAERINSDLRTVSAQPNQISGTGSHDDCFSRSEEVSRSQPVSFESDNEMWRQFLFGDCNDKLEDMLEEARKIAAKKLCPSERASSPNDDSAVDEKQPSVHVVQNMLDFDHVLDSHQHNLKTRFDLSWVDSGRHRADFHTSAPGFPSESVPDHLFSSTDTDQATVGSSSSISEALTNIVHENPCQSDAWSVITAKGSEVALSKAPVPRSDATSDCGDNFRFAKPKLFIGKKASHWGEERQLALSEPQIRGRTLSRYRQKRTGDGRTCIRKLPNFTKDPIEDVEEDIQVCQAENASLFGPLDTEDCREA